MNTERKVVDALALAANRLHEPPVLNAYQQLLTLVDSQLGGQIAGKAGAALTEPQLVFVAYGLKHLHGSQALPLLRAADALVAALSEVYVPQAVVATDPVQDEPIITERPRRPRIVTRTRMQVNNVSNRIENASGNITIAGTVTHHNYVPQPMTLPEMDSVDDEPDAVEPAAAQSPHYDVFLSYSRPNAEQMRRLRTDLRAAGLLVWTDENLNIGTPSWKRAVEEAIRQTYCVVVLMTPESKVSEWVERELNSAKTLNKSIYPVLVRGNGKNAIPFMLNSYQYIDLRREPDYRGGVQKLVKAIRADLRRK